MAIHFRPYHAASAAAILWIALLPQAWAMPVAVHDQPTMVVLAAVEERENRAVDFGADLVQRTALVSRIQDVLAELGIYTGPSDGQFTATTERAIRIYESQVELAITGQPTRALLDHLQTVGRANKLLVRLEQTRDRNQETARNVLFASTVAERLRSDETHTANPLRDPAPCFANPTPTCLLLEGFESAKAIGDTRFRDWAMGDVAVARAAAGLTEEVYRTVGLIDDPRLIVAALRDAAVAWAEGGQIANAREMMDGMPEPMFAAEILAAIATARAREGDAASVGQILGELLAVANSGQNTSATIMLIADLAPKLHAANATDAANHLLQVALDSAHDATISQSERDRAIGAISAVHAALGQTERARTLMARIEDPAMRRPVLLALAEHSVQSGGDPRALQDATDVSDSRYRVVALTHVAIAQARVGNLEGARSSLAQARADTARIDDRFTYAKAFAVSKISAALAEMRGYEDAAETAAKIEDSGLRAQSLWHLASVQARDGSAGSAKTRSLAWEATKSITSDLDRSWTLSRLALSSAERGETDLAKTTFEAALAVAAQIENSFARATALAKLATILVQLRRGAESR
jgi:hypothetical protein